MKSDDSFEYKLGSLALNTGTILAVFRHNGTEPVEIDLFTASAKGLQISGEICLRKYVLIPSTQKLFLAFIELICSSTSCESVGARLKVFADGVARYFLKSQLPGAILTERLLPTFAK